MDAAREQALINYATRCHRDADRLDATPPADVRLLLREHLKHSAALAILLLTTSSPSTPAAPPSGPWWRRWVRRIAAYGMRL